MSQAIMKRNIKAKIGISIISLLKLKVVARPNSGWNANKLDFYDGGRMK